MKFNFSDEVYEYETLYWNKDHVILESQGHIVKGRLFTMNGHELKQIFVNDLEATVVMRGKAKRASQNNAISKGSLQSPMPGKIFKVLKGIGDQVEKGDSVLIVEAMKMEHTIKATSNGLIKKIFFKEGDQVQGGVLLCEIE
mgnify:FL=1